MTAKIFKLPFSWLALADSRMDAQFWYDVCAELRKQGFEPEHAPPHAVRAAIKKLGRTTNRE